MNVVLIYQQSKGNPTQAEYSRERKECAQIIAIARYLKACGMPEPMLICEKNSLLEANAKRHDLLYLSPPNNPLNYFRLWRWLKKQPFLVIIGVGSFSIDAAKLIARIHGKDKAFLAFAFYLAPPALTTRQKGVVAGARICFCGSEEIASRIEEAIPPLSNIRILPPGIDLGAYTFPASSSPAFDSSRHFVFGMAESLGEDSGALLVIRAMAALWQKENLPPWEVRMFGTGPRFQDIFFEAETLGVLPKLAILPETPVAAASAACHAWLAPGKNPYEFPSTFWTGAAAGLPTIGSRTALHMERLDGLDAALLVNENNPQELAKAMIAVIQDHKLAATLVENGDILRPRTGLDAMAKKICNILQLEFSKIRH